MTGIRVLISRVLDLLLSGRRERRLEEEIRNHLDLLAEQYMADGMTPSRGEAGGAPRLRRRRADEGALPRSAWIAPGRCARAGFPLRAPAAAPESRVRAHRGAGARRRDRREQHAVHDPEPHTLRGLPIPSSDRVVWLSTIDDRGRDRGVSFADYQDITAGVQHYVGIAAFEDGPMVIAGDGRAADRLDGAYVTANAFDLIGTRPLLGRSFSAADDEPGAAGVAVLTRTAWETRFGADPGVLGRVMTVNGVPAALIGVMPDRSGFPAQPRYGYRSLRRRDLRY